MKKILTLVTLVFLFPSVSFATSGACSYHSGVNCAAGASYTGNVQCNDGWINSAVYFSDAQECKVASYCPATYSNISSCNDIKVEGQRRENGTAALVVMQGLAGSSVGAGMISAIQAETTQKYDACVNSVNLYNSCMISLYGYDPVSGKIVPTAAEAAYLESLKPSDSRCQQSLGSHGYLNTRTNACSCNEDYWLQGGKCVEPKSYCLATLGVNSHPSSDMCLCDDGYNAYSGKCTENYKEEREIDQEVKAKIDQGGGCNEFTFSLKQKQSCVVYQANRSKFRWKIIERTEAPITFTSLDKAPSESLETKNATRQSEVSSFRVFLPNKNENASTPKPSNSVEGGPRIGIKNSLTETSLSSTTEEKIVTERIPKVKRWYHWLNPFLWFK